MAARIELVFDLPTTYPTLRYKQIRVSPKIILSQTLHLGNFSTASQSCCQQKSSTIELVDHSYDGRRVVAGQLDRKQSRTLDKLYPTTSP